MIENLVSVIIPVFNRQDYVAETIESVINQTYNNIEIVIINDGSTDNSEEIIRSFAAHYPKKINLINQQNQGQVKARNNGLKVARGEFIAFLDSDDVWLPEKIEKQIHLFENEVGLVYSGVQYIDALGKVIGGELCDQSIRGSVYEKLLVKNRMTGGTVVVKNEALKKVGLFDETLKAAENWDLWIRIAKFYELDFVDETLLKYRKHSDNMSGNNNLMLDATYNILEKHCLNSGVEEVTGEACKVATANYYYRVGVYLASISDYTNARMNFQKATKYVPNYLDCNIRITRSYLGKRINALVSALAKKIKSILTSRKKQGNVW